VRSLKKTMDGMFDSSSTENKGTRLVNLHNAPVVWQHSNGVDLRTAHGALSVFNGCKKCEACYRDECRTKPWMRRTS
jgi:hypothetical protein